eukprot:CAMPEP_0174713492 /NCGR_PEP_ID=MMETSP1094-20130205/14130_1 /TAXON_ID=156173 /ORGANISM="Chrysochromulina brevifilum, Strain UTEX LB 985" /LENGTH=492 /DNA_ID=CAMNT_0015912673 /DNA_START=12 /DNA_END=1490 /DNA_ORIENTATION=-
MRSLTVSPFARCSRALDRTRIGSMRGMSAYQGKSKKLTPEEQGVAPVGSGVPMGTPRENWDAYGYSTRCASVVKVSDFALRRVKAVSLPIVLGSTFELDDAAHGARLHSKLEAPYADGDGYVYGRWGSPTNEGAARQLAALEGVGPDSEGGCMLFTSGMSAITGALMAVLKNGDHAVLPYAVYGGTNEFFVQFAVDWGIEYTLVDATDPSAYARALRPNTKVVYTESPANPTCRLTDLPAVSQICDAHAAKGHTRPILMCDSTFATPFHQRCLEHEGVDIAIHSATKYIGGHSDIVAGAVTSKSGKIMHEVAKVQKLFGAALAPLESFLLARGLRTLHVRMERHGENAMKVAQYLDSHPMIESTFYPGLPSHPDHELAKQVFTSGGEGCLSRRAQSFGGMLAFILKGDDETALRRARRMCERLELVTLAVSLGGTESLIEHPASMTHTMIPREDRIAGGLADGLVRLSVGLEDIDDILNDLKQAIDGCDDGL